MKYRAMLRAAYTQSEQTLVMSCSEELNLQSRADITACVDDMVEVMLEVTKGRPIYLVIDYANFKFNLAENDFLRVETERMVRMANIVTIVRFGADSLMRAAARTRSMKMHAPSHLYSTLEEARDVIRQLREGKLTIGRSTG
jgi:hypothetical protein